VKDAGESGAFSPQVPDIPPVSKKMPGWLEQHFHLGGGASRESGKLGMTLLINLPILDGESLTGR
jgi:hypothetical protein